MEITNTRVSSAPRPTSDTTRPYLMVIAGGRVGELHTLTRERTIVGRSPEAHLRLEGTGISREHVELSVDGGRVSFRDLGSTNGTFLNGARTEARELRAGDKLSVGAATMLLFTHAEGLEAGYQRGRFLSAVRDPATAALKREVFIERLREEVSFSRRHAVPLAVLAWELDDFAALDERVGPKAMQQILASVARAVGRALRDDDVLADVLAVLGPGQFVVACRETDLHAASERAGRLRAAVAATKPEDGQKRAALTASVGVAVCGRGNDQTASAAGALLRNARAAVAAARARGGDRVEIDGTTLATQDHT